jgi:hypothetical protein
MNARYVVKRIIISTSPYQNILQRGLFQNHHISLEISEDEIGSKNDILSMLNNNHGFKFSSNTLYGPYIITSYDMEKAREIVDFLHQNNLIGSSDRADIEGKIREVEANQIKSNVNKDALTPAQQNILESMYEEQIDALTKAVSTPDELAIFLHFLEDGYYSVPGEKPGTKNAYQDFKGWLAAKNKFTLAEINEFVESMDYLKKIYNGKGNLETTFQRLDRKRSRNDTFLTA